VHLIEMVEELNKLVAEEEIDDEEVPQVKTVKHMLQNEKNLIKFN
ncbi:31871_t:CDS:1, partial [Gigaspora margarita]